MTLGKKIISPLTLVSIFFVFILVAYFSNFKRNTQSNLPLHFEWSNSYKNNSIEIAGFTEEENWIGDYTLDSERSLDGNTGLNMYSQNNIQRDIRLIKEIDLTPYNFIFMTIYVEDEQFLQQKDNFIFYYITNEKKEFNTPIIGIKRGWNLFKFKNTLTNKKVSAVGFKLNSLNKQVSQITLDRIWAEKNDRPYMSRISVLDPISVSFKTIDAHTYLNLFSSGLNRISFIQSTELTDFTATFKAIPESKGSLGFFITSKELSDSEVSFLITHENKWKLETTDKKNSQKNIASGKVQELYNISTPLWLRIIRKGSVLIVDYSINGNIFNTLVKTDKISIGPGSFGLLSNGSFLLDYLDLKP